MDAFLLHCLLLLWISIGAARQLHTLVSDRLLTAALLAWGNIVLTCLLLSLGHKLGDPGWFLGASILLGLLALISARLVARTDPQSAPVPDADSGGTVNPWMVMAFILALLPVAWPNLKSAWVYVPDYHAALAHDLPRVLFYIGQKSLGHFGAGDPQLVWLPFNYQLLQLFVLVYDAPLAALNLIGLTSCGVIGIALYRLCRLGTFSPGTALLCTWLALAAWLVFGPVITGTRDLPALAACLCSLVFFFRWRASRRGRDALLSGLAIGLAAGSELALLGFFSLAALAALAVCYRQSRKPPASRLRDGLRSWILPALVVLILALPFALINRIAGGRWLHSWRDLYLYSFPKSAGPVPAPSLPVLVPFRLTPQARINVDTDGIDEDLFRLMTLGHEQRFTARRRTDPGSYNLLSRSPASRNAAYQNSRDLPSYVLLPIANKPTAGVEFLGQVGNGATARDYFGIEAGAGRTTPINSNRNLLITLYREPGGEDSDAPARITVAGLNPEDHLELTVHLEASDQAVVPLATFRSDGAAAILINRPFKRLVFRAPHQISRAQLGAVTIPCRPIAEPPELVNPNLPSGPHSLFVTDVVLAQASDRVLVEGLLPLEGPFPQWDLPYLRWAREPSTRITIQPIDRFSHLRVSFSVRLNVRLKAALDVLFNGQLVQRHRIDAGDVWLDQTLELTPQAGPNVLEFKDAPLNETPDWLAYLDRYPDVKDYLVSRKLPLAAGAREHYESHGWAEGRTLPTKLEPEPAPDGYYFMYRNIRLEGFTSP